MTLSQGKLGDITWPSLEECWEIKLGPRLNNLPATTSFPEHISIKPTLGLLGIQTERAVSCLHEGVCFRG